MIIQYMLLHIFQANYVVASIPTASVRCCGIAGISNLYAHEPLVNCCQLQVGACLDV